MCQYNYIAYATGAMMCMPPAQLEYYRPIMFSLHVSSKKKFGALPSINHCAQRTLWISPFCAAFSLFYQSFAINLIINPDDGSRFIKDVHMHKCTYISLRLIDIIIIRVFFSR